MIFVTVGAQMPFDRLVRAVDAWAAERPEDEVFAQIGETDFVPQNLKYVRSMTQAEFESRLAAADVVVAHAGMGTIISALVLGKQVVVVPRRAALGETRNDHQVATAERFSERGMVVDAEDENRLIEVLAHLAEVGPAERIGTHASPELLTALRNFIETAT